MRGGSSGGLCKEATNQKKNMIARIPREINQACDYYYKRIFNFKLVCLFAYYVINVFSVCFKS